MLPWRKEEWTGGLKGKERKERKMEVWDEEGWFVLVLVLWMVVVVGVGMADEEAPTNIEETEEEKRKKTETSEKGESYPYAR